MMHRCCRHINTIRCSVARYCGAIDAGCMPTRSSKASKGECKGKPPRHKHRGGMEGQLRKLRKGIHPKTGSSMPAAVEMDPVAPPTRSGKEEDEHVTPHGFYEYVPAALPAAQPVSAMHGPSTADRQMAMLERIRAKQLQHLQVCAAPVTPTFAQMGICDCDAYVCTCGGAAGYDGRAQYPGSREPCATGADTCVHERPDTNASSCPVQGYCVSCGYQRHGSNYLPCRSTYIRH